MRLVAEKFNARIQRTEIPTNARIVSSSKISIIPTDGNLFLGDLWRAKCGFAGLTCANLTVKSRVSRVESRRAGQSINCGIPYFSTLATNIRPKMMRSNHPRLITPSHHI